VHEEARAALRIEREGLAGDLLVAGVIEDLRLLPRGLLRAVAGAARVVDLTRVERST
jgi:hypothetical protein